MSNQRRSQKARASAKLARKVGRSCGGCEACCTALRIVQLGKPVFQGCTHLTCGGCGIYDRRPRVCRGYECGWKLGLGEEKLCRPDKLGALIEETKARGDGRPVILFRPLVPSLIPSWAQFRAMQTVDQQVRHQVGEGAARVAWEPRFRPRNPESTRPFFILTGDRITYANFCTMAREYQIRFTQDPAEE